MQKKCCLDARGRHGLGLRGWWWAWSLSYRLVEIMASALEAGDRHGLGLVSRDLDSCLGLGLHDLNQVS